MPMILCEDVDTSDPRFDDILEGVETTKVVECHGAEDDDSTYVFLIWTTDRNPLERNAKRIGADVHFLAPGLYSWSETVTH